MSMRRFGWLFCLAGLAAVFQGAPAWAQSGLSRRDRLLLFQDYQQNRVNNRQVQKLQQQINTDVRDFRDLYKYNMDNRASSDPVERYLRSGREFEPTNERLPPIYSGRRNYFMRMQHFNPPTRR